MKATLSIPAWSRYFSIRFTVSLVSGDGKKNGLKIGRTPIHGAWNVFPPRQVSVGLKHICSTQPLSAKGKLKGRELSSQSRLTLQSTRGCYCGRSSKRQAGKKSCIVTLTAWSLNHLIYISSNIRWTNRHLELWPWTNHAAIC